MTATKIYSYKIWEKNLDVIQVGNSCPIAFMITLLYIHQWNAGWVEKQNTGNREINLTTLTIKQVLVNVSLGLLM